MKSVNTSRIPIAQGEAHEGREAETGALLMKETGAERSTLFSVWQRAVCENFLSRIGARIGVCRNAASPATCAPTRAAGDVQRPVILASQVRDVEDCLSRESEARFDWNDGILSGCRTRSP